MKYYENMFEHWFAKFFKGLFIFAFFMLVFGFAFLYLWNALIPDLFGGPTISYWQGIGLILLSKALFGSWSSGGEHKYKRHHRSKHHWKSKVRENWANMTEEERAEYRDNWKKHCRPGYKSKSDNVSSDEDTTSDVEEIKD